MSTIKLIIRIIQEQKLICKIVLNWIEKCGRSGTDFELAAGFKVAISDIYEVKSCI